MKRGHKVCTSVLSQNLIDYHQVSNGVIRSIESNEEQKGECFRALHNFMQSYGRQQKEQEMERNKVD